MFRTIALGACCFILQSCSDSSDPSAPKHVAKPPIFGPTPEQPNQESNDKALAQTFASIAASYQTWPRIVQNKWAHAMCEPPTISANSPQFSTTADTSVHEQKLYHLFTDQPTLYENVSAKAPAGFEAPVGFTIVKESHMPLEIPAPAPRTNAEVARKDGKFYKAGKQGPLFIMLKQAATTPATDKGWVYATVDPSDNKLTASGAIASCVACHQKAPHDRLFGLAPPKER